MVKDDWPPPSLTAQDFTRILKFRLILQMVKDDWLPHQLPQDFTRNFKV